MRMITPSMKELASTRYALMQRGFMNQSDIAKFVPCGKAKAKKILISIRADTKSHSNPSIWIRGRLKRLVYQTL